MKVLQSQPPQGFLANQAGSLVMAFSQGITFMLNA